MSPEQARGSWTVVALAAIAVAAVVWLVDWRTAPPDVAAAFTVEAPQRGLLAVGEPLSPDGRTLAFAAPSRDGVPVLWVRALDALLPQALAGTEGASQAFWSPDSAHLAFVADGRLKRVAARGGAVQVICVLPDPEGTQGGSWGAAGVILLGTRDTLLRVPATGGEPLPASKRDAAAGEQWHTQPHFLPGGRRFLFNAISDGFANHQVYVGTLDSLERQRLEGIRSPVRYAMTGHLLFLRGEALMAQSFDADSLAFRGEPVEIADRVAAGSNTALFSAANGTLAYVAIADSETELQWFDRAGSPLGLAGGRDRYLNPELSRDGRRIAVDLNRQGNIDVYILDLVRGVLERVTTHLAADYTPIWSPTGDAVMFTSYRGGTGRIYRRDLGAAAEDTLVLETDKEQRLQDWSSDGQYIVYAQEQPATDARPAHEDRWAWRLGSGEAPTRITDTIADEINARISPNGRWVAYSSNEPGQMEIYAQAFPRPGAKQQVSSGGGLTPTWTPDGSKLIYVTADGWVMAAGVTESGASLELAAPTRLFRADIAFTGIRRILNVTSDGRILLNVIPPDRAAPALVVVQDWTSRLGR